MPKGSPKETNHLAKGTFPILSRDPNLSRKPPETQGKRIRSLERTMVEKHGEYINTDILARRAPLYFLTCFPGSTIPVPCFESDSNGCSRRVIVYRTCRDFPLLVVRGICHWAYFLIIPGGETANGSDSRVSSK